MNHQFDIQETPDLESVLNNDPSLKEDYLTLMQQLRKFKDNIKCHVKG